MIIFYSYINYGYLLSKAYHQKRHPNVVFSVAYKLLLMFFLFFLSLLFILVSTYKLARSQFSLSTSINCISIFIIFFNYLLDHI